MHYLLRTVASASDLLLYTETCRQWGHLIRDAVGCLLLVHNASEKESVGTPGYHHASVFTLSKHMLDMADGLSLLVDQGTGAPARPMLRSLFDAQIALSYITKPGGQDTITRALAYQVAHAYHRIRTLRLLDPDTQEGQEFLAEVKDDPVWNALQHAPRESGRILEELEALLKLPEFAPVVAEWTRVRQKRKAEPQWYWLFDGPLSIKAMASETGHIGGYRLLYSLWVGSLQAGDAMGNLTRNAEGRAILRPLRFPADLQNITVMVVHAILGAAEELMKMYDKNPGTRDSFMKLYRDTVEERYSALRKNPHILNIAY
jgi:hypothetical protein